MVIAEILNNVNPSIGPMRPRIRIVASRLRVIRCGYGSSLATAAVLAIAFSAASKPACMIARAYQLTGRWRQDQRLKVRVPGHRDKPLGAVGEGTEVRTGDFKSHLRFSSLARFPRSTTSAQVAKASCKPAIVPAPPVAVPAPAIDLRPPQAPAAVPPGLGWPC